MSSVKEIKKRIKSVKDTQKITNAMYLVASAKLTTSKALINSFRPYFNEVAKQAQAILKTVNPSDSIYTRTDLPGNKACLVIGSDKGLAGDFNKQIAKCAANYSAGNPDTVIYVIGEKVKQILENEGVKYDKSFNHSVKKPDDEAAVCLENEFKKLYKDGVISSLDVIYTDFGNGVNHKPVISKILPVETGGDAYGDTGEFIPNKKTVTDIVIPLYLRAQIWAILYNSFCSEQNSRMTAMKNANDNAKDLLSQLTLEYNHVRQNAITREITEISGERSKS